VLLIHDYHVLIGVKGAPQPGVVPVFPLWQSSRGSWGALKVREGTVSDDGRYWAFISYSHKDAVFGRRLHRRLEAYALPRRLVGRLTAQGAASRRLTPIFRDREELPAANDLSAEVRAALKASRCLIVVCSPAAAVSPWVAREVALFRELHPNRPILAAVREGDPVTAGDRFGMIRFGSRTDLYLPEGVLPLVLEGQTMIGGETVIAEMAP